jgi:hypothetical protein
MKRSATFFNTNIKQFAIIATVAVVALVVALTAPLLQAHAATTTVNPGESIQAAINAASDGDTIVLASGTYTEYFEITKPLTIRGDGTVVVQTKTSTNIGSGYTVTGGDKGVDIQNTQNVTLENITFDGENDTTTAQNGININSVRTVALNNIIVRNYARNAIGVTAQQSADRVAGGDITFSNVVTENAGWAGIAFYTNASTGYTAPLSGIVFEGTTTVSNTQYGLQFGGDSGTAEPITGVNGAPVDLGRIILADNQSNFLNGLGNVAIVAIQAGNLTVFANATIEKTNTPSVPNTGIVQ